jgi:hypothetical protein
LNLEKELLDALNNPTGFWNGVIQRLEPASRTALLVLRTLNAPAPLPKWAAATANLDPSHAAMFEACILPLDDVFIRTSRDESVNHVDFRNPSMLDFCAEFLEKNSAAATHIVRSNPLPEQLVNLADLALDAAGAKHRYPNLRAQLIELDVILLSKLSSNIAARCAIPDLNLLGALVDVLGASPFEGTKEHSDAGDSFSEVLQAANFRSRGWIIYEVFQRRTRTLTAQSALGPRFANFYSTLCDSATSAGDFDTLLEIDQAIDGGHDGWGSIFEDALDGWIDDVQTASEVRYLEQVVNRLWDAIGTDQREVDWEEIASNVSEDDFDDSDDDWRQHRDEGDNTGSVERDEVDSMFVGLSESRDS